LLTGFSETYSLHFFLQAGPVQKIVLQPAKGKFCCCLLYASSFSAIAAVVVNNIWVRKSCTGM